MLHKNRYWSIAPVESAEQLADTLTNHDWCGCNGFSLEGYLFLNDSTGPDGAQEYAVVRRVHDYYVQFESITFSWMTTEKALEVIKQIVDGSYDESAHYGMVLANHIETPEQHGRCHLCM